MSYHRTMFAITIAAYQDALQGGIERYTLRFPYEIMGLAV